MRCWIGIYEPVTLGEEMMFARLARAFNAAGTFSIRAPTGPPRSISDLTRSPAPAALSEAPPADVDHRAFPDLDAMRYALGVGRGTHRHGPLVAVHRAAERALGGSQGASSGAIYLFGNNRDGLPQTVIDQCGVDMKILTVADLYNYEAAAIILYWHQQRLA